VQKTVQTQEAIIVRLEDVLEKQMSHAHSAGAQRNPAWRHPRERRLREGTAASSLTPKRPSEPAYSDPQAEGSGVGGDASDGEGNADGAPQQQDDASDGSSVRSDAGDQDASDGDSKGNADDTGEEEKGQDDDGAPEVDPDNEFAIDPMWGGGDKMKCTKKAWTKAMAQLAAKGTRLKVRCLGIVAYLCFLVVSLCACVCMCGWMGVVQVVEDQLLVNARDFAGEMSQLKVELMEYEMVGLLCAPQRGMFVFTDAECVCRGCGVDLIVTAMQRVTMAVAMEATAAVASLVATMMMAVPLTLTRARVRAWLEPIVSVVHWLFSQACILLVVAAAHHLGPYAPSGGSPSCYHFDKLWSLVCSKRMHCPLSATQPRPCQHLRPP